MSASWLGAGDNWALWRPPHHERGSQVGEGAGRAYFVRITTSG